MATLLPLIVSPLISHPDCSSKETKNARISLLFSWLPYHFLLGFAGPDRQPRGNTAERVRFFYFLSTKNFGQGFTEDGDVG